MLLLQTTKNMDIHILTCPMEDESHMAVVYCLSSSGALSFRSSVSIATRTLDTWLGLSEKASHKEILLRERDSTHGAHVAVYE